MKKIVVLLMLLVSLASANAKCDWSKVSLGKSNKCNAYTFEVTGTVDTCYKHSILIVKKGSTTATYTGTSRVFSYTFKDTGYYYVKVSIKNKCCGGDTLIYNLIHVECKPSKCDWSKVKFTQQNNRNNYRFYLDGVNLDDTCIGYVYIVYSVKTGQIDTMYSKNGITDITFNEKGKYRVYLKIWDRCKKCDTSLVKEVNIEYFNQCKYSYKLSNTTNTCNDSITAEMSLGTTARYDTCWQYWHYVYHGPMLDSFTQGQWDTMSDYELFANYNFNDSDLVVIQGPENKARVLKYKFPTEGHYLVIPQWYNSCTGQDTFMFRRITIEKCNKTRIPLISKNSVLISPNPANDRVSICLTIPTKNPICAYVLYDASGKVVMSGSISNCTQLNVSNLMNGIYTFKTGNLTQKIVISH